MYFLLFFLCYYFSNYQVIAQGNAVNFNYTNYLFSNITKPSFTYGTVYTTYLRNSGSEIFNAVNDAGVIQLIRFNLTNNVSS
jgi:hypothetical protein